MEAAEFLRKRKEYKAGQLFFLEPLQGILPGCAGIELIQLLEIPLPGQQRIQLLLGGAHNTDFHSSFRPFTGC